MKSLIQLKLALFMIESSALLALEYWGCSLIFSRNSLDSDESQMKKLPSNQYFRCNLHGKPAVDHESVKVVLLREVHVCHANHLLGTAQILVDIERGIQRDVAICVEEFVKSTVRVRNQIHESVDLRIVVDHLVYLIVSNFYVGYE